MTTNNQFEPQLQETQPLGAQVGGAPVLQQDAQSGYPQSNPPQPLAQDAPGGYGPGFGVRAGAPVKKKRNVVGIIGLVLALVGTLLSLKVSLFYVGSAVLTVSLLLSIVGVCLRNRVKWQAGLGITLSIVGSVAGAVVAITAESGPFAEIKESFFEGVEKGIYESGDPNVEGETRENPMRIDYGVASPNWEIYIDSVKIAGKDPLAKAVSKLTPPAKGNVHVVAYPYVVYVGSATEGAAPEFTIKYVTPDGTILDPAPVPDDAEGAFDMSVILKTGEEAKGGLVFEVPEATANEGTFAVTAEKGLLPSFIALK